MASTKGKKAKFLFYTYAPIIWAKVIKVAEASGRKPDPACLKTIWKGIQKRGMRRDRTDEKFERRMDIEVLRLFWKV